MLSKQEILRNATDVKCEKCESLDFKKVMRFKKVSKLLTGDTEDSLIPLSVIVCAKCGHVNKEFELDLSDLIKPQI